MTHAKGAATLADYAWEYDPAGRMTRFVSSADGTVDYTNDGTGQLTGADYDYQSDENYVYDDNGNRVSGGFTVGPNNQMTSDGTFAYLYDAEGNRTDKFLDHDADGRLGSGDTDITGYAWDHRNRLTEVTHFADHAAYTTQTPDKVVQYAYDHGNRWVRKALDTDGDGTAESSTIFVYDGNQITLQLDDATPADPATATDLSHRYLWGTAVDQILADETPGAAAPEDILWPLTDHLNTVRDLAQHDSATDTTSVANHLAYDAFGNVTSETTPAVDSLFHFTARPFDPDTGLQNNLNRWNDLSTGRWISEDRLGVRAGDSNLYRYVHNQATTGLDPLGLADDPESPLDTVLRYLKTVWGAYTSEGGPFALSLMEHYARGSGKLYKRGLEYVHGKDSHAEVFPVGLEDHSRQWSKFMKERPQIQESARKFFAAETKRIAQLWGPGKPVEIPDVRFTDKEAPSVKLDTPKSMLLTLHGSNKIVVDGYYQVRCKEPAPGKIDVYVEFEWMTWRWHDKGDLHKGVKTIVSEGAYMTDDEFEALGIGKEYPIEISWTVRENEWVLRSGSAEPEQLSGWPPLPEEKPAGGGDR